MKNRTDFVSVGVKEQLVQAVRNQWEAARAVLWALLGLVVGLGNMMLEISPFGAALCAAVPLKNLIPAALGSAVGSLLLSGLVGGNFTIKYAAAILLIAVVRRMGREQLQRWSDYRPLVSAALAFFGLLLPTAAMLLAQPFSAYKLVLALAEATVAGACAYFLDRSLRAFSLGQGLFTLTRADFISVVLTACIVVVSLSISPSEASRLADCWRRRWCCCVPCWAASVGAPSRASSAVRRSAWRCSQRCSCWGSTRWRGWRRGSFPAWANLAARGPTP